MTYRELYYIIQKMNGKQLDSDVTIFVESLQEYLPVDSGIQHAKHDNDVLDYGHPYLEIEWERNMEIIILAIICLLLNKRNDNEWNFILRFL